MDFLVSSFFKGSAQVVLTGLHGGDDTAIGQQVDACDESGMLAKQEFTGRGDFIRGAHTSCGGRVDHFLVAFTGCVEFILSKRSDDDARADGVDARSLISPCCGGSGLDAQMVGALGSNVGEAGIGDRVLLDEGQISELICGS